ncbi:hypothetical protein [Poseidonocella sedimentorum]|uniref:Holin-X, holin superfamily III n=1 Tax=Poseidonocella sedimentorum TaxID=871652 RepID=A0A1I6DTL9_9RHOB|nr:hypothetical protein [Poseidonocella sedimentorum]SFR08702.1 hypothetical protein SAMN04515673_105112 [Poseidonocella sedimentorum]
MLEALQDKAAEGARRAAWAVVGSLLLAVGAGFLTVAAWMVLDAVRDAQFAALVIGLTYAGGGILALGFGAARTHRSRRPLGHGAQGPAHLRSTPEAPAADPFERMARAFAEGFQTGRAMRR